ncbi:MAG: EamA family transporter [Caulobacterales bacterium]
MNENKDARLGLTVALITQCIWGLLPLWTGLYTHTPAMQLFVWRVLFCALTATIFVFLLNQHQALFALLRSPRRWPPYVFAGCLLACNWFGFFRCVEVDRVLEVSFATYLLPLLSIAVGVLFLREKLTIWTGVGLTAAALGVGAMFLNAAGAPWFGLLLATTFATYTVIRKMNPIAPLAGLAFETWVMALGVTAFLLLTPGNTYFAPSGDLAHTAWMISFGPQTALTMVMFNFATHHLKLSTTGMLQFVSPTIVLVTALLFGEPLTGAKAAGFALIWIGVVCYMIDAIRARAAHKAEMERTIESLDVR